MVCGKLRQQGFNFLGGNVYLKVLCVEGGGGWTPPEGALEGLVPLELPLSCDSVPFFDVQVDSKKKDSLLSKLSTGSFRKNEKFYMLICKG